LDLTTSFVEKRRMTLVTTDNPTILLADDDEHLLRGLEFNLKRQGYRVITATNGTKAASLAARHAPQLVILDVIMPGMDGIEVCREIRGRNARTPILMLSAKAEREDREAAAEAGANAYLTKPFKLASLLTAIRELIDDGQLEFGSRSINR
jgi:DNA-binding response OmpR family regulator